jgi:hypothetical protein
MAQTVTCRFELINPAGFASSGMNVCPFRKSYPVWIGAIGQDHRNIRATFTILHAPKISVADIFKSRRRLETENLFRRHQHNIALRRAPSRLRMHGSDRTLLVWIKRIWPGLLDLAQVVQPGTIPRCHRSGRKAFWRWKSRHRAGRPKIDRGLRDLIQWMGRKNPLRGAPRRHCDLLMLGFDRDTPLHRAVQWSGTIEAIPILAGLHHQYVRM